MTNELWAPPTRSAFCILHPSARPPLASPPISRRSQHPTRPAQISRPVGGRLIRPSGRASRSQTVARACRQANRTAHSLAHPSPLTQHVEQALANSTFVQAQRTTVSRLKLADIRRSLNGKNLTCLGLHPTLNQTSSVELDVQCKYIRRQAR